MTTKLYAPESTGLLFIDPYNDFLSEGGKLFPRLKGTIEANNVLDHLRRIVAAARGAGIRLFVVPHHKAEPNDFATWKHPTPYQLGAAKMQIFEKGSWGAEWHPDFAPKDGDVVIKEHWAQNGFANTDLDHQLKQHGIARVILIGMVANTCVESTGRYAMELGYHVTLVTDATAAFEPAMLHAAHVFNAPTFAHAIVTTAELLAAL
ncbi:cysteine hydrolase family protein [Polyangium fumosum]|uniref:Cysteine hydrolase n=1 Tax=Polyangium fumosum TaxID=889272 RepID=A0A4U1IZZ7_9BACT|nr:isochorismatase family cysteine hydrolase [Polyangium fumosum]TKD00317.1 cysteine hydrolase [Polyangium fumosum]